MIDISHYCLGGILSRQLHVSEFKVPRRWPVVFDSIWPWNYFFTETETFMGKPIAVLRYFIV
jgi:hypothetical protein